jgi:hypothetical protein
MQFPLEHPQKTQFPLERPKKTQMQIPLEHPKSAQMQSLSPPPLPVHLLLGRVQIESRPEDSSSAWNGPKTLQIPLNPQTLTPKSWSKNIRDGGYCAPVLSKLGTKGEVGMEKYAGKTTRGQTSFQNWGRNEKSGRKQGKN